MNKVTGLITALIVSEGVIVDNNAKGLSLLEVLLAVLMLSIAILGLINLHAVLMAELNIAKNHLKAERAAFELLEVYPALITVNLPHGWRYQFTNQSYNRGCQRVRVIIQPNLGKDITQERLYCQ